MSKQARTTTARSVAISEARMQTQPIANHRKLVEHRAEKQLGPPMVGTPWPDLRPQDLSIEGYSVQSRNLRSWGIRFRLSKRILCILAFSSVLAYASISHDGKIVKKVVLAMRKLILN